jgi:gas vesicle protein
MASNDNSGALLVAFVAGAVTGAALALLFAPATGEQTRDFLGERAREGRSNLTTAFDRAREQFQQKANAASAEASAPREEPQA